MSDTPQVLPEDDQEELVSKEDQQQLWYNTYAKMPYKDLAIKMVELRDEAAKAKSKESNLNAELDVIRLRVVPQRFAEDGLSSMNIPGAGRLGLSKDAYCTQIKGTQEEFFQWLCDNEYGDLIKDTVNPSSLKSLVKELQTEAESSDVEFEPGAEEVETDKSKFDQITEKFVNFTPFMRASVTKSK